MEEHVTTSAGALATTLADDWSVLQAVTEQLNAAPVREATLQAFLLPAPRREEPSLDARAAAALTRTAHALRLLGVLPVLSGVRPEVARALVDLDIPLAGIATCGTLQAAVMYALQHLGKKL